MAGSLPRRPAGAVPSPAGAAPPGGRRPGVSVARALDGPSLSQLSRPEAPPPPPPAPRPGAAEIGASEAAALLLNLEVALAEGCPGSAEAEALRDRLREFAASAPLGSTMAVTAAEAALADDALRCVEDAQRGRAARRALLLGAAGVGILLMFV